MTTNRIYFYGVCTAFLILAVAIALFALPAVADAQTSTTETAEFLFEKKISDNLPNDPYAPEDFSFDVDGYGVVSLTPGPGSGIATAIIELELGTYTVEEIGPDGFVPDDWTVQWSGHGCDNSNGPIGPTTITVGEDSLENGPNSSGNVCRADNQYRGEDTNGEPEEGDATLIIKKVIVGTTTSADDFSFAVNDGATTAFDSDGENEMTVATGTYDIVEVGDTSDYTIVYENCSNIELDEGETETCTITNTYDDDNGGGDNGGSIGGTKYNTANEATVSGWTMELYDGEDLVTSTTTDADGEYWFVDLAPGDYVVCEALPEFWHQTQPTDGPECANGTFGHDVTITGSSTEDGNDFWNIHDPVIIVDKVASGGGDTEFEFNASWLEENFFLTNSSEPFHSGDLSELMGTSSTFSIEEVNIPTDWTLDSVSCESSLGHQESADAIELSPGEVVTCIFTNSTDSDGGGGNGDGGSSGGGGKKIELTENGGGGGGSISLTPDVLGAQTNIIPASAPSTGAGGAAPRVSLLISAFLVAVISFGAILATRRRV